MEENQAVILALEESGLTKTESLIYLALVRKGPSTAYRISKEANLYKANTYMALESLVGKGIVIKRTSNKKQLLEAVPPEDLINNIERQKERLQAAVPLIRRNFGEEYQEVTVFSGLTPFFNILYKILELNQPIYVFDIPAFVPDVVKTHISQFHKERIKKKVEMWHIYDYDAKERISYLNKMQYTHAKRGEGNRQSLVSTFACGDTTLIINWKKGMKTVKIVDKDVAETYRQQFNLLWKQSK